MSGIPNPSSTCVLGTGIDTLLVSRIGNVLDRRPGFIDRVLRQDEQAQLDGIVNERARLKSIAARIAAKEAVMKVLQGGIWDLGFLSIEVRGGRNKPPSIKLHGRANVRAAELGITSVQVSMSHDGDMAIALAIGSRSCPGETL